MQPYRNQSDADAEDEIAELAGDGEDIATFSAESIHDAQNSALDLIQKERDEYQDLLLRKQAEFENFRKRTNREREELRSAAHAEVIRELLPVIDACEKGLESLESGPDSGTTFKEGYGLLLRQLRGVLERFGVREAPGIGARFDPGVHEAVMREVSEAHEEHSVLEEYRKGYLIGDRLLRPSQVKVSVRPD